MIAKIKLFVLTAKANYYANMSRNCSRKAIELINQGRFDEAECYLARSTEYLMKQCDVTVDLVRTA